MLGYLGFDGFTSTFQDKLYKGYQMETYNQMLWVNFCSAVISSFWLFSDSSMGAAIQFIKDHPEALNDVLILSAASTCGQLCILYTIREFGALLFATLYYQAFVKNAAKKEAEGKEETVAAQARAGRRLETRVCPREKRR